MTLLPESTHGEIGTRHPSEASAAVGLFVETHSLSALAEEEAGCTRCPLYKNATQVVPGEGSPQSRVLLIGEQPGDQEDLSGRPFVGPSGKLLDIALERAGVARDKCFVTNAVKHFKFEPRGKRRLHKKPDASEIDACRWWLDRERALVRPGLVVALGATAIRGALGRSETVSRLRGEITHLGDGAQFRATVHPSALLRLNDGLDKREAWRGLLADLRKIAQWIEKDDAREDGRAALIASLACAGAAQAELLKFETRPNGADEAVSARGKLNGESHEIVGTLSKPAQPPNGGAKSICDRDAAERKCETPRA